VALALQVRAGPVVNTVRSSPGSTAWVRGKERARAFVQTSKLMAIRHESMLQAEAIPGAPLPAAFEQRVLSLQREEDWDGQEADAITTDTCAAALQFVRQVVAIQPDLPLPFPAPSVYGAVSLRWVNGDQDLAIYVYSPDRVETYFQQPDGRYAVLPAQPAEATELLLAFKPQQR